MKISAILKIVQKDNIQTGCCSHCRKPMDSSSKNKKYHSECVFDANKYGIKAKFRNHTYMHVYLGSGYSKGQGKRSGSMIKGAMSVAEPMWSSPVPVTVDNVRRSLNMYAQQINLCNGAWVTAKDALILAEYLDSNRNANLTK